MASILPLPPGVVGEFVGRAHVDLSRVTELLNAYPTLLHASWDWGNGDWETALGAAAHSGKKDVVEFLLSRGARIDIFTAAFLNKLPLVKAFLHESPNALHSTGPHGISLLDHAKKSGNTETTRHLTALLNPPKKSSAPKGSLTRQTNPTNPAKLKLKRRKAA